jgi:hypothetical protein
MKIFDQFHYENKNFSIRFADAILKPCTWAFGRQITCLKKSAEQEGNPAIEFRTENQLIHKTPLDRVVKAGQVLFAIATNALIAPLTFTAILIKWQGNKTEKILQERFSKAYGQKDNPQKDKEQDSVKIVSQKNFITRSIGISNNTSHSFDYDENTHAAHVIADKEIRSRASLKDLEGGLPISTAKELFTAVQKCQRNYGNLSVELETQLKQYLESCEDHFALEFIHLLSGFSKTINKLSSLSRSPLLKNLIEKHQKEIGELEVGKTLLYPVNIRTQSGGHAIVAAITKKEIDGKVSYDLTVGNTGLGLPHHYHEKQRNRIMVYPYILKDMSLAQITDKEFLEKFILIATCHEKDVKCNIFYGHLNAYAKNQGITVINKDTSPADIPDFKQKARPAQRSGTCILKSPLSGLKAILPLQTYKTMIFEMKIDQFKELFAKQQIPRSTIKYIFSSSYRKKHNQEAELYEICNDKMKTWIEKQTKNRTGKTTVTKEEKQETIEKYFGKDSKMKEHVEALITKKSFSNFE